VTIVVIPNAHSPVILFADEESQPIADEEFNRFD
jgi:hypothetical protein